MNAIINRDWESDRELAPDIVPKSLSPPSSTSILLTGATGYLGRYVLRDLLRSVDGTIYCLARAGGEGDAASRVAHAQLAADGLVCPTRIKVLPARLTDTHFGLSKRSYDALCEDVSAIVHCAADVSWSRSYAELHAANVLPVSHLLRLACQGSRKHFSLISSMAVCYSTDTALCTSEESDPTDYLARIPLGYAQTKAIAESLVRQAVTRGIDATILRPSLITGPTCAGGANAQDFVSWLLSGCIRMGFAPDVDWHLDIVPVDYAASAIRANISGQSGLRTLHIAHPQPRSWRELVLLLNLFGYPLQLESFDKWLDRLARVPDKGLPLKRFRKFFSEPAMPGGDVSVSQIYESGGRLRISNEKSDAHLAAQGLPFPTLDADYFALYLHSLAQAQLLPPQRKVPRRRTELDADVLRALKPLGASTLTSSKLTPAPFRADGSITSEIASWHHGGHIGLYGVSSNPGVHRADLVLKISASEAESRATARAVADGCCAPLGELFDRFAARLDFVGSPRREAAVYTSDAKPILPRIPRCYAVGAEPASGRSMLLLERLSEVRLLNSAGQLHLWRERHIRTAIRDLAAIHAAFYGQKTLPRGIERLDAGAMLEPLDLWSLLCLQAMPFFAKYGGDALCMRVRALISTAHCWMPRYAEQPFTLIHNDCNPRNMAIRLGRVPATCLYDWELCTGAPAQRDLAEFLCFTFDPAGGLDRARRLVELHRSELSQQARTAIDAPQWLAGFRLALADFMVRRISVYAMLHRHIHQAFLPRVIRNWDILNQVFQ